MLQNSVVEVNNMPHKKEKKENWKKKVKQRIVKHRVVNIIASKTFTKYINNIHHVKGTENKSIFIIHDYTLIC